MEALLWEPVSSNTTTEPAVRCLACSHFCIIAAEKTGRCGVRANRAGRLESLVRGGIIAAHVDPVEKKPLYHYLPGTATFSFGTEGCNFQCSFCQNSDISQRPRLAGHVRQQAVTPKALVAAAKEQHCASIAFTYTEPGVFIELVNDVAHEARDAGLGTILVSNGFQSAHSVELLRPKIHAANIDIKSSNPAFYTTYCGGRLEPVLDTVCRMREAGWWLEITTLLIPGLNDSDEDIRAIARFIVQKLGPDVPWHVSAFHPAFRMLDRPATPPETLGRAWMIGREEGLLFVYPGNVAPAASAILAPYGADRATLCPCCGTVCITRTPAVQGAFSGCCPKCGQSIAGIWTL